MKVEDVLGRGRCNALSSRSVMMALGYDPNGSQRAFRKQVERERAAGALILSCGDGLYLPCDDGEAGRREAADFLIYSESKPKSVFFSNRHIRKFARGIPDPNQLEISEVD